MTTATSNGMHRDVRPTTPHDDTSPRISKMKDVAAGMPAIISTAKHGISKMGAFRSLSNLRRVNKFDGFDCPGCAWPDPDEHRTFAEGLLWNLNSFDQWGGELGKKIAREITENISKKNKVQSFSSSTSSLLNEIKKLKIF